MIRLLTVNIIEKKTESLQLKYLAAQIINGKRFGWNKDNTYVMANIDINEDATIIKLPLNTICPTGSKIYTIKKLYETTDIDEVWSQDLDLWQVAQFGMPNIKDMGICTLNQGGYYWGGSVFYKKSSIDIINDIWNNMEIEQSRKSHVITDEPIINKLKHKYSNRITELNMTYNLGCSMFNQKYLKADKPIKTVHFHPEMESKWALMTGRNDYSVCLLDNFLIDLLAKIK